MLLWLLLSWVFQRRVPWRTEEISELKINLNRALSVLTRNVIIKEIDLFFVLFRSKQVKFAFSALALSYIHQICKKDKIKNCFEMYWEHLSPPTLSPKCSKWTVPRNWAESMKTRFPAVFKTSNIQTWPYESSRQATKYRNGSDL